MKRLSNLIILALFSLLLSCSKDTDEPPLAEKNARIEVDFEGSLDQYLINFGIYAMYKGESGLVTPIIRQPAGTEWTQIVTEGNSYNLSTPLTFQKLIVESEEPVHTVGFIFNAIYTGGIPDDNFQGLSATIRVFGNNEEIE